MKTGSVSFRDCGRHSSKHETIQVDIDLFVAYQPKWLASINNTDGTLHFIASRFQVRLTHERHSPSNSCDDFYLGSLSRKSHFWTYTFDQSSTELVNYQHNYNDHTTLCGKRSNLCFQTYVQTVLRWMWYACVAKVDEFVLNEKEYLERQLILKHNFLN